MPNEPFVIERVYNASPERIWKALTEKEQIKQWSFHIAEFEPVVGFEFKFDGGPDGRVYHHVCVITEVLPFKKLSYTWRYEGYAGNSHVTYELFPEGCQTRIRLTHEGLHTFPANEPDLAAHNFAAGWTAIVGTSLKDFVEAG